MRCQEVDEHPAGATCARGIRRLCFDSVTVLCGQVKDGHGWYRQSGYEDQILILRGKTSGIHAVGDEMSAEHARCCYPQEWRQQIYPRQRKHMK
jgi:hypothetical protein